MFNRGIADELTKREDAVYHAAALDGFQMNWKNGFVRLWIAVSLLWMIFPAYLLLTARKLSDTSDL